MSSIFCAPENAESILARVSADARDVPWLSLKGMRTIARVVSVTDGDTVVLVIALALPEGKDGDQAHTLCKVHARLNGIDTCELRSHEPILRAKAQEARDALKALLMPPTSDNMVDVTCHEFDRYGRVLVDLCSHPAGESVSAHMLSHNLAFECIDGSRLSEEAQLQRLRRLET